MAKAKLYTGIALEDDGLKIAVIKIQNKKVQVVNLDKITLLEKIKPESDTIQNQDVFGGSGEIDLDDDSVFDLDLDSALADDLDSSELDLEKDILGELGDDIDLELDELDSSEDSIIDVDLVDETDGPVSNEVQVFNYLTDLNPKRVDLGLNIPAGNAIFQILKDVDFNEVKKKDLKVIIDDRLEALYGSPRDDDYYSYGIRDDGALVLSSIEGDSLLLQLVNRTQNLYRGKVFIGEILPDESILLGMVKANYELEDEGITCVLQLSEKSCRVIFLNGNKLWLVSPIITEGTKSRKFLNTVFSKILFQLDTGEVPNLDRLILCNNTMGEQSISFFNERFPDVDVSEFNFSEELFDPGENTLDSIAPFTTSIGIAWAASGFKKEIFSKISFVPKYVSERQKIFKLQWHGFMLLGLIFASILFINDVWQKSFVQINDLENQVSLIDTQIDSYAPTINNYNRVSSQLSQIQDQLELMNTLAENSITWSVNMDLINSGIQEIGGVWLTTITPGDQENTLSIQGIARSQSKVHLVAEIFADATLLDVTISQIRDVEVFNFSYDVHKIVENTSVYTPENLQGLEALTGQ